MTSFTPFGRVLRDLLVQREIVNQMGNPNWSAFAELTDGVHYETLRKAVTGERQPTPETMEKVAQALDLEPTVFDEYKLWLAQREFDPREVGSENALRALEAWTEFQRRRRK